ncbi:cyclin-like protein [Suillus clintonianus]|uniref:cyclin-like protein n=1 Tax=Suillus clintonianus TaxID=1904413 RepID=UPI001B864204|nr:cyclin-like protein [Suillus clintonianus]KAG2135298.1 cyclin-like protein [Suillus clintonianus]
MSSNLPTRRVTRVTRTTVQKDSENANARPSRIISRVKPPSTSAIPAPTATLQSRALGATATSRAKVSANDENKLDPALQGKRKREALGEVTTKNINKNKAAATAAKDAKGKGKEVAAPTKETFDGVVIKAKPTIPLRQTTATTIRRTTRSAIAPVVKPLKDVKEEPVVNDEDAMAVDDHPPAPEPSRRVSTRRSGANTQQVITQEVQRVQTTRRTSSHLVLKAETQDEVQDDRVFKKRRTSSDAPETDIDEQAQHEAEVAAVLDDDVAPEADPDGDEWDDLDAEDSDDPLMVSEYVVEIFKYMKLTELITLPNPEYMASQKELAWSMRGILLDWLVQVHARFRLLPETLFLCVNIIDRFLSARVVSLAKLQLVGITCLFVASKVEEIVAPSVSHFLHCADSSYTESEILLAERYVLKTIDWNLSYPNPMHFLRRISKADDYDVKSRTMGKYLLEVGTLEWRLLATPPSLVAAAAIWLGRLILGNDKWTPNHAHYSSYAESSIIPTANLMLNYILKPVRHESFYKKYAGKRFMKVSILVREWALERWEEGEQVSLLAELPAIRAKNRAERERLAAAGMDGDEDFKDENS